MLDAREEQVSSCWMFGASSNCWASHSSEVELKAGREAENKGSKGLDEIEVSFEVAAGRTAEQIAAEVEGETRMRLKPTVDTEVSAVRHTENRIAGMALEPVEVLGIGTR